MSGVDRSELRQIRHDMRTLLGQIVALCELLDDEARTRALPDFIDDRATIRDAAEQAFALQDAWWKAVDPGEEER